ncbi:MAG: signal peptidase I [Erysipelotrichaceae bacterium]
MHQKNVSPTSSNKIQSKISSILFISLVFLSILLTSLLFRVNIVNGASMEPTIHNGDILITQSSYCPWFSLERGDIVDVNAKEISVTTSDLLLKRVIGLPGETIKFDNGKVFINGIQLKEPYTRDLASNRVNTDVIETKLKKDEYFVMGDNRNNSLDSRAFGPVKKSQIIAKLFFAS